MKLTLDRLADKGCWISDDRVNAFVSRSGIAEIGYHGTQPVSKNSRILIGEGGAVLSFALRTSDGEEHPISFNEVEWTPTRIVAYDRYCTIQILAHRRCIRCAVCPNEAGLPSGTGSPNDEVEVVLALHLDGLNLNAHGTRTWSDPEVVSDSVLFSCHDQILLNEWLKRTGPYAGDFMIPEPMRRIIFKRLVRSGEATHEDVYPEFRDAAIPIYDATVFVRIGGSHVKVDREDRMIERQVSKVIPGLTRDPVIFTAYAGPERDAEFFIQLGDQRSDVEAPPTPAPSARAKSQPVSIELPNHPAVQQFVETVPGLVDSAIVRDHGMPRATPAAYYWIWAWDSMVTGMEMFRWGDYTTARQMSSFIKGHRDRGMIPMRWTRSLAPLDTPPRGSLEFLFASFVYQYALETGNLGPLIDAYPYLIHHLEMIGRKSDDEGMFAGSGFYPDFAARFGRSASSVVAMEVAAHYAFSRILENVARLLSDTSTEWRATKTADRIEAHFLDRFWDDERGFLFDAYDMETGSTNKSYPLFTMLFLQSSLGIPLIRSRMDRLAKFCSEELLASFGTSLLPAWDKNRMNEDATASWYPHWDVYLLKILRRGGRSAEIIQWLENVERVLEHLGYCPEFIKLDQDPDDPASWLNHGAVSNLNCVTGWFRALLEGLLGLEIDPGGLSIVPLSLPIETLSLDNLVYKGSRWKINVKNQGEYLDTLVIDGIRWRGICKVPVRYYDGGEHSLEVHYGSNEPNLQFREIINAEVVDVDGSDDSLSVTIRPLGTCEVVFFAGGQPELFINGKTTEFEFDERSGVGTARVRNKDEVEVRLELS